MATLGEFMNRLRGKQMIIEEMVTARLQLFKEYSTPGDGNDHNREELYRNLIMQHVTLNQPQDRKHYLRLAALSFAAIEALERERCEICGGPVPCHCNEMEGQG